MFCMEKHSLNSIGGVYIMTPPPVAVLEVVRVPVCDSDRPGQPGVVVVDPARGFRGSDDWDNSFVDT